MDRSFYWRLDFEVCQARRPAACDLIQIFEEETDDLISWFKYLVAYWKAGRAWVGRGAKRFTTTLNRCRILSLSVLPAPSLLNTAWQPGSLWLKSSCWWQMQSSKFLTERQQSWWALLESYGSLPLIRSRSVFIVLSIVLSRKWVCVYALNAIQTALAEEKVSFKYRKKGFKHKVGWRASWEKKRLFNLRILTWFTIYCVER